MRRKEERSKQGHTCIYMYKQQGKATQHTQAVYIHVCVCVYKYSIQYSSSCWLSSLQRMVSRPTWEPAWPPSTREPAVSSALETLTERAASGLLHSVCMCVGGGRGEGEGGGVYIATVHAEVDAWRCVTHASVCVYNVCVVSVQYCGGSESSWR